MHAHVLFFCLLPTTVFVVAFYKEIVFLNFSNIALVAGGALTAMIAITALFYTRAEAWSFSKNKNECLSAAEKCFTGTMRFATGFIVGAGLITAASLFPNLLTSMGLFEWILLTIPVAATTVYSFYEFIYGISIAIHLKHNSSAMLEPGVIAEKKQTKLTAASTKRRRSEK